jgi:hypothetical protein
MNCDCLEKLEQSLKEYYQKTEAKNSRIESVTINNLAISIGIGLITYNPATLTIVKDTANGEKVSNRKINMYHTFCPFCGIKIQEEAQL